MRYFKIVLSNACICFIEFVIAVALFGAVFTVGIAVADYSYVPMAVLTTAKQIILTSTELLTQPP
jgi:hypothetical protein